MGWTYEGIFWSDKRIKKNIESSNLGLNFVRLLQPKKYTWKKSKTPRVKYGALAQDVEQAIKQLSDEETSLISVPDYHKNTEEENEHKLKGVNSHQIMWILFNAVKELDAEVQDLKKQLEEK